MKIIAVDNYARETVADRLVADNITIPSEAKIMLDALQKTCGRASSIWYHVRPDDYVLSRGMADIVGDEA